MPTVEVGGPQGLVLVASRHLAGACERHPRQSLIDSGDLDTYLAELGVKQL